jgi:hypothetical protein
VRAPAAPGWRAFFTQLRALKDAIAAARTPEQAERAIPEKQFTQDEYEGGGDAVENRDYWLSSILASRCEAARFRIPPAFDRFFDEAAARCKERDLIEQAEEEAEEEASQSDQPKRKPKYQAPPWLGEDGFGRASNWVVDHCLPLMSATTAKVLFYCYRLADKDGHFWVTQEAVAHMLGGGGRDTGRHAMRTLIRADIVRVIRLGRKMGQRGTATEYAFTPPSDLYLGNVEAELKGRWGGVRPGAGRPPRQRSSG